MFSLISSLNPYSLLLKLGVICTICITCFFAGYRFSSNIYKPRIEELQVQVKSYEDAYLHLSSLTAKQNSTVEDLESKGKEKELQVKKAQDKAKQFSSELYKQAEEILKLKNTTNDVCLDASDLIEKELAKERK